MTFQSVQCEVCHQVKFSTSEIIAYQVRNSILKRVDLEEQQPWSGVWCVCKSCIRWLGEIVQEQEYQSQ